MSASPRRSREDDAGSVTPFVLLLCACLAALLGLVAEGGLVLSDRETALAEAEQAARAGVAVLTTSTLRAGGIATGGGAAISAAERFMARSGHPGTASEANGVITATVTPFRVSTPLLALAGVASISVTASASASAVVG
ncbi:MAG: hypothetical protein ABSE47_11630 [Acidimicrobiales bacterium]